MEHTDNKSEEDVRVQFSHHQEEIIEKQKEQINVLTLDNAKLKTKVDKLKKKLLQFAKVIRYLEALHFIFHSVFHFNTAL